MTMMPWENLFVAGWRIVGMNHYHVRGIPHLFCSMANKADKCITAESTDEAEVFTMLEKKAGIPQVESLRLVNG